MPRRAGRCGKLRCRGEEVAMTEDPEVAAHLEKVTPAKRRRDAQTLLGLMRRVTGAEPKLHGSIIGFGTYHYRYDSGREGDGPAASFAPRKAATVVYLMDGIGTHEEALTRLGPHETGVGCLYLKDLEQVDLDVLEGIIARSWATLTADTYGKRARDGGSD
jgi:hypothetical protein